MIKNDKEIKRRVASGPGIPSEVGETPEFRKIRLDRQYLGHPFITEGSVFCFPLVDYVQGPTIMVNNYKIIALVVYKNNGVLYGATTGDEDHIFFMDKKKMIIDIGKIPDKKINENSLVIASNSLLYFAATDSEKATIIYKHDVDTDYTDQYPLDYIGTIIETGIKIMNEIFIETAFNEWDKNVYFLGESGKIFKLDTDNNKIDVLLKLDENFSKTFCLDNNGNIYFVLYGGEIARFNMIEKKMFNTNIRVPSQKGREYLAGAMKMIIKNNIIFGCTSHDNYLFRYDIDKNEIFNFGRPDENYDLRSIVVEKDGRIFGTTTTKNRGLGHLFFYGENGFKDLGNIVGYSPANGWCNEPSIMVLGIDGEIFIADGDNRSKLFIYFPKL